jgi:hypothetical protein
MLDDDDDDDGVFISAQPSRLHGPKGQSEENSIELCHKMGVVV